MEGEIRILMLEDNPDDVQLTKMMLSKSDIDFSINVIDREKELKAEDFKKYDIVLCDYNITDYDGVSSINYIRQYSDIPVIILSGSISENMGFDLLKAGADDFVKKPYLKKLPIVIEKVIANAQLRRHADECLKKFEETSQMFEALFDGLDNPVFLKDSDRRYVRVNAAFCTLYEKSEYELIGNTDEEINWAHQNKSYQDDLHILEKGLSSNYELSYIGNSGKRVWLEVTKNPITINGKITGILGQAKNITQKKDAISVMEKSQHILHQAEELTVSGSFEYDVELDLVTCSKNLVKMLGMHSNQISLGRLVRLIKEEDRSIFLDGVNQSIESKKEYRMQHRYFINDKNQGSFEILFRPDYKDEAGNTFYGTILNTTKESKENISRIEHQEQSKIEIARELHDNLGQKLNAMSMFLGKATECDECSSLIEKSTSLLHEGIDDLGNLLANISVKHIDDISLSYALEKLSSFLPDSMNLQFDCNIDESKVSQFVKRQAFRVVQETMNNAIKYSNAANLKISLTHDGSILSIIIEDDGVGFNMDEDSSGNGLMNITHRVKNSNGLLNIDSKKGQGTRVTVKMPVN